MLRILLLTIFCASCYGAVPRTTNINQDSRIVGGKTVDIKDYPYQVAIYKYDIQFCGGSIISERWVLSAAHCGLSQPAPLDAYSLRVGSSYMDHDGTLYSVAQIINHPKFAIETIDYDVALFKAASPIEFGVNAKPIQLADKTPPAVTLLTITGWGDTGEERDQPEQLQMVQIPVIDHKLCEKEHAPVMNVSENMLCGEVAGSGNGFCHGDSGGAATDGKVQVGIVSWRWPFCLVPGKPNVFADVAALRQWIKDNSGV